MRGRAHAGGARDDVAFAGGASGRVDLPGADARELIRSLERLAKLDARDMHPGHMAPVLGTAREALSESLDNARIMIGRSAYRARSHKP